MKLEGRRALITGGGRGIGRAIALAFAEEGARVLIAARTQRELDDVAASAPAVQTARCDLSDRAQVRALAEIAAERLSGLDILVNNAGIWMEKPFLEYTRQDWDTTLAVNLTAAFDATQALLPLLLRSESARIVNIASIDGQVGFPRLVAQCASKAGLLGMTRALAKELYDGPITVNAICPAAVNKDVAYDETPARAPRPELALPWDVARAAVYLASDEGVAINGSELSVHGVGFLAS